MIRRAAKEDVSEIVEFMNSVFGLNPQAGKSFLEWVDGEKFNVVVARSDGELVGVSAVSVQENLADEYVCFGNGALDFLRDRLAGVFLTLAVAPKLRRLGIGKQMGLEQVQWFREKRCDVLVGSSWQSGSCDNSSHLFEGAGFQKLGESVEYLRQQSQRTGLKCSVCGGECSCKSIFYGLLLDHALKIPAYPQSEMA